MFAYAFIEGIKNGWLDAEEYAPVARKAWMAMVAYVNENGDVRNVCTGTNKKNDKQYYYDRKRNVGDYHGQAALFVVRCSFDSIEKIILKRSYAFPLCFFDNLAVSLCCSCYGAA